MTKLRLRIDFEPGGSLGPGKIQLLEGIRDTRSISAAARALAMSYRRAWLLVDALNRTFREPVTHAMTGGRQGGGAELTEFGHALIAHYRALERDALAVAAERLAFLQSAVVEESPAAPGADDASFHDDPGARPGCAGQARSLCRKT